MIKKSFAYAVVGASKNPEKYGHKVLADLKKAGYKVAAVNPGEKEVLGLKCYNSILDIGFKIDVAIFVVPPEISEKIIADVKAKNIKNVWFQPGSESKKAIEYCQKNNINFTVNACIMIKRPK